MKELVGDLFEQEAEAICITTNGYVKTGREAVMGRGCAATAARYWPELPKILGEHLLTQGNTVAVLSRLPKSENMRTSRYLVCFPVKPDHVISNGQTNVMSRYQSAYRKGTEVPGWAARADLDLISQSAKQLRLLTDQEGWKTVVLPRPGCGYGELRWEIVRPVLQDWLDERFSCITWGRDTLVTRR